MNRILWIGVLVVALTCTYFVTTNIVDRRAAHRERIAAEQRARVIDAQMERDRIKFEREMAQWKANIDRVEAENEKAFQQLVQPPDPFGTTGQ